MFKSKYSAAPVGVCRGGPGTRRKNPKRSNVAVLAVPKVDTPPEAPKPVAATVRRIKINMMP